MRVTVLLALVAVLALATLASAQANSNSNATGEVASSSVQAVLRLDHEFDQQQQQQRGVRGEREEAWGAIPSNSAYSYSVATKLFWHSVSAYCPASALSSWTCASCKQFGGFVTTKVMSNKVNQGYVGYFTQGLPASPIPGSYVRASDPFVLVSFRGTIATIDAWIQDLSFAKLSPFSSNYPAVQVHGGFWSGYQSLKADMLAGLDAALAKTRANTIIITGHSLGGAMAELAALDLKLTKYPSLNFAVYSQGAPRSGNAAFGQLYTQLMNATFREVHNADVVPHLPPKLLGFQHPPLELWFNEAFDRYAVCNSTMNGEDPKCSNSIPIPASISDHTHYRNIEMGQYCSTHKLSGEQKEGMLRAEREAEQVAQWDIATQVDDEFRVPDEAPLMQQQPTAAAPSKQEKIILREE